LKAEEGRNFSFLGHRTEVAMQQRREAGAYQGGMTGFAVKAKAFAKGDQGQFRVPCFEFEFELIINCLPFCDTLF
jgi:hypothetical protein